MNEKKRAFKALLCGAYLDAKNAHACTFGDPDKNIPKDKTSALSYAAACTAKSSAAEAIYCLSPELAQLGIAELLGKFDTFTDEIREDFKTDHSRQWVDIEFGRLEELYQNAMAELGDE